MNQTKIATGLLILCGVLMLLMGFQLVALPVLNPPIVSGIGFLLAAYLFGSHKH